MKQILSFLILLAFVQISSAQLTRCYSYDAAGNRTNRVSCVQAIQNPNREDELAPHAISSISADLGRTSSGVRDQLFSGDISSMVVYPNPSSGVFHLNDVFSIEAMLKVYDSAGKSVWSHDGIPDQIDLMHLANGTYYMVISEGEKLRSAKVIISK
jgi:Secretion system C-terminal sorting domain